MAKAFVGSNPTLCTTFGPLAVLMRLKRLGRKESTLVSIGRKLRCLAKHVDLSQPEEVLEFIANKNCSDGHKDNLVDAYSHYCQFYGLKWTKPKYMREERITRIPKEEDINRIIAHAKPKYAVAYSVMRDIGLRPTELGSLQVKDVDLQSGDVYPTTAKHGASRVLRVKPTTLAMLKAYISAHNLTQTDTLWKAIRVKENWGRLKKTVAKKLGEPHLASIRLYDLRHFAGSMTYHRTKDIVFTMRFLGHKNITNTLRYVHPVNFGNEEFTCKVAETVEDASQLIEQGFEYVTEVEGVKLFRKRK